MRKIVVTGASSGIGRAIMQHASADGAEVVAVCRSTPDMPEVRHVAVDLQDTASIEAGFAQIGEFDVLINNAGVAYSAKVSDGALEQWDEMWNVNVRALAYASHLALKAFPESGGQIINLSSMSGHRVPPGGGFYAPTKFAVRALTEALRLELRAAGNLTRVSSVSPGFVDTPLLETYFRGREEQLAATRASMEFLTADQLAEQVMHILRTPLNVEIGDISLRSVGQSV